MKEKIKKILFGENPEKEEMMLNILDLIAFLTTFAIIDLIIYGLAKLAGII